MRDASRAGLSAAPIATADSRTATENSVQRSRASTPYSCDARRPPVRRPAGIPMARAGPRIAAPSRSTVATSRPHRSEDAHVKHLREMVPSSSSRPPFDSHYRSNISRTVSWWPHGERKMASTVTPAPTCAFTRTKWTGASANSTGRGARRDGGITAALAARQRDAFVRVAQDAMPEPSGIFLCVHRHPHFLAAADSYRALTLEPSSCADPVPTRSAVRWRLTGFLPAPTLSRIVSVRSSRRTMCQAGASGPRKIARQSRRDTDRGERHGPRSAVRRGRPG